MKIAVKVIPKAHKNSIEIMDGVYVVRTTVVPDKGKANEQVIKMLAKYFKVGKSCVSIVKGHKDRQKIVEIMR